MAPRQFDVSALAQGSLDDQILLLGTSAPPSKLLQTGPILAARVPFGNGRRSIATINGRITGRHLARISAFFGPEIERSTLRVLTPTPDVAPVLERGGYRSHRFLQAMVLDLRKLKRRPRAGSNIQRIELSQLAEVNSAAYGNDPTIAAALQALPPELEQRTRLYGAVASRKVVAVLATIDRVHEHGIDCGIHYVATAPDQRGHGYGTDLINTALIQARIDYEAETSTLLGRYGETLYQRRLGYRTSRLIKVYDLCTTEGGITGE